VRDAVRIAVYLMINQIERFGSLVVVLRDEGRLLAADWC
jgi:hypothetical protein